MKKLLFTIAIAISLLLVMTFAVCAEQITVVDGTDDITLGDCVIEGLDREIPKPSEGLTFVLDTETKTAKATAWANYQDATLGQVLVLPSTVLYEGETYSVTTFNRLIGNANPYGYSADNFTLTSIYLPDTIVSIPKQAFDTARAMRYIYVGSGVTTIGEASFRCVGFTAQSKVDENGEEKGNIVDFIWKTDKLTTLSKECFYHLDFNVSHTIEFKFENIKTYSSGCMAYNQHSFANSHKNNRQLYLDVFDITGAESVATDAFSNAALAKTIVVRADQLNALSPNKLRGGGTAQPDLNFDFVVIGGETAATAKSLNGAVWTADANYWTAKVHCTISFRGYVNAYDGVDGFSRQNAYGNDAVDYFFDSEETFNHYFNSIATTTSKVSTYTNFAKNNKGYFNYCVIDENGNHAFKAINLKYTAASDGVEESVSLVEYAQSSYTFGLPTYNTIMEGDCTASNLCYCCDFTFSEGKAHVLNDAVLLYLNGYTKAGVERITCANEGCTLCKDTPIAALFTSKGYSQDESSSAIVLDIAANIDAISAYEAYLQLTNSEATIKFGVVVALADSDENTENDKLIDGEGNVKAGTVAVKFPDKTYANIQTKIMGIGSENYETALHLSGYVNVNGVVTYINGKEENDYSAKVYYGMFAEEE